MSNEEPPKADILQGTPDRMVLHTLDVLDPLHGYAIAARLEQVSGGAHRLNMGTLYPGLMRLEQRGLMRARWLPARRAAAVDPVDTLRGRVAAQHVLFVGRLKLSELGVTGSVVGAPGGRTSSSQNINIDVITTSASRRPRRQCG
jgi:hypothetical protein